MLNMTLKVLCTFICGSGSEICRPEDFNDFKYLHTNYLHYLR